MSINHVSRRSLVMTGAFALVAPTSLVCAARESSPMTTEQLIRQYYASYEKKDWRLMDSLLADNFTFTSPNDDDHISKSAFKARCWPQSKLIERFELENVLTDGSNALVKNLCRTIKGTSILNVDYFRVDNGRITAIECYFGGRLGYPSASISGKP
jgi:ketosteroid isomerase-like protein